MRKSHPIAKTLGQRIPSYADGFISNDTRKRLQHLVAPHVDSFDYCLDHGLIQAIEDLSYQDLKLPDDGPFIKVGVTSIHVASPSVRDDNIERKLGPREARERGFTYAGAMSMDLVVEVTESSLGSGDSSISNSLAVGNEMCNAYTIPVKLGNLPIMTMSSKCNLYGMDSRQLLDMKEEANECGGYFVINGIEKVIRLLQV
jgi:DNA-directed RNA polymerase I subunit RPA2